MEPTIAVISICVTIMVIFVSKLYFNAKYRNQPVSRGFPNAKSKDTEQKLQYLLAENEELQERLKRIEYLLSQPEDERQKIELDKQKKSIRLDK